MLEIVGTAAPESRRPGVSCSPADQHREDKPTARKVQPVASALGGSIINNRPESQSARAARIRAAILAEAAANASTITVAVRGNQFVATINPYPRGRRQMGLNRVFPDAAQALGYARRLQRENEGWKIADRTGDSATLAPCDPQRKFGGRPVVYISPTYEVGVRPRPWAAPFPKIYGGIDAAVSAAVALSFEFAGDHGGPLEIREGSANG